MKPLSGLIKKLVQIEVELQKPEIHKNFMLQAKEQIYKRVKVFGKGLTNDGKLTTRLKELSPAYIEQRKKNPPKGIYGTPKKSNLTNTGEMLEAIEGKTIKGGFELSINNNTRKDGKTNKEVAKHVAENGRPFFGLSESENRVIITQYKNVIRKLVRMKLKGR